MSNFLFLDRLGISVPARCSRKQPSGSRHRARLPGQRAPGLGRERSRQPQASPCPVSRSEPLCEADSFLPFSPSRRWGSQLCSCYPCCSWESAASFSSTRRRPGCGPSQPRRTRWWSSPMPSQDWARVSELCPLSCPLLPWRVRGNRVACG